MAWSALVWARVNQASDQPALHVEDPDGGGGQQARDGDAEQQRPVAVEIAENLADAMISRSSC